MHRKASLSSPRRPGVAARAGRTIRGLAAVAAVLGTASITACSASGGGEGDDSSGRPGSEKGSVANELPAARGPGAASGSVPVEITAELGGTAHRVRGDGECTYAEEAFIRDISSSMWQVNYRGRDGGLSHASVTIWRPVGGGVDQLSVIVEGESGRHQINTVVGSERAGSGAVLLRPQGDGIRLELDGRDEEGTTIRLTIACARLTPAMAEGG